MTPVLGKTSRVLALAVVAIAAWFTMAGSAAPAGTIVISGAASGSTLRLSVQGNRIHVKGLLARGEQQGCRVLRRAEANCSLRGVSSVELRMGPSGDMVEVLDKLPVPLTAYLGNGSDKIVANGETDTCYPGGAKRNRCVLGPGDDVCITGDRNSDCVGGAGNDYCEHGDGSDGCWGGPGDDVCVMKGGQDGCHGEGGDDRLYGGGSPDQLYGGAGRDYCNGGPGVGKSHECESGPQR